MGSEKSHFNVSLIARDKITRQRPQITPSEEKGEPKQIRTEVPFAYQPNALLPGQTVVRVRSLCTYPPPLSSSPSPHPVPRGSGHKANQDTHQLVIATDAIHNDIARVQHSLTHT